VEVAGVFDRELHDFGYDLRRYTQLTYEDIPSVIRDMFVPAQVRDFGLRQQMMVMVDHVFPGGVRCAVALPTGKK